MRYPIFEWRIIYQDYGYSLRKNEEDVISDLNYSDNVDCGSTIDLYNGEKILILILRLFLIF